MRRLRGSDVLRGMVRETELSPQHLVMPMFVELGTDSRTPVEAMPGVERLSISHAVEEAGAVHDLGVPAVLLFGLPAEKDLQATGAYDERGCRAAGRSRAQGGAPRPGGARPPSVCAATRPTGTAAWFATTARSTTTSRWSCWPRRPSRTPSPVPMPWRPAT